LSEWALINLVSRPFPKQVLYQAELCPDIEIPGFSSTFPRTRKRTRREQMDDTDTVVPE
jgi:hypothetical protein